jgi:uncharacterized protein
MPDSPYAVADAHLHFFSYRYFRMLTAQRGISATAENVKASIEMVGWEVPDEDPRAFARRWVEELDRHGVKQAALMASVPGDEDSVAQALDEFPDRFFGYFFLNPVAENGHHTVREALEQGMRGICLLPAMHRFSMREARVDAVIKQVTGTPGCVIFVHCGILSVGIRGKLGLSCMFDMSYSNPMDLHPVALRYPELPFVVPHFGAGYFREALMLAHLCPNVYFDTSSTNSWMKLQAANLTLTDVFRKALDVVGPNRLLFGTNSVGFPQGWDRSILDQQLAVFDELQLSEQERRAILGDNLRRILQRE